MLNHEKDILWRQLPLGVRKLQQNCYSAVRSASGGRALRWVRRKGHGLAKHFDTRLGLMRVFTQVAAILPSSILTLIQP
jgi:hypothetical protein